MTLDIASLTHEIKVSEFAKLSGASPDTVRRMIRENIIRARPMVPGSKRVTWLVQTDQLYDLMGIEREPEYVSPILG